MARRHSRTVYPTPARHEIEQFCSEAWLASHARRTHRVLLLDGEKRGLDEGQRVVHPQALVHICGMCRDAAGIEGGGGLGHVDELSECICVPSRTCTLPDVVISGMMKLL